MIERAGFDFLHRKFREFSSAVSGATTLEYIVIAVFLSVAIVVSIRSVGLDVHDDFFVLVRDALSGRFGTSHPGG